MAQTLLLFDSKSESIFVSISYFYIIVSAMEYYTAKFSAAYLVNHCGLVISLIVNDFGNTLSTVFLC